MENGKWRMQNGRQEDNKLSIINFQFSNRTEGPQMTVPVHVGIIMDGNGRWAKSKGLIRTQGHLEGLKAAKRIVKAASDLGIKFLTLYAFSTENWKRAGDEVDFIMGLVKQYLKAELDFSKKNKLRTRFTGDMNGLPADIRNELIDSMEATKHFDGMQVILAINYGGRDEIIRSFKKISQSIASKNNTIEEFSKTISNLNESDFAACLDNPDIPDPDLIIRTAGEYRTSNFLLWQSAYSELYISDKFWPDWNIDDLQTAINEYKKRERKFGNVAA